jgi:putative zinc finger/helix-turn-helix YgiT family protein
MITCKSCPRGHGEMPLKKINKNITFRGVQIAFEKKSYVCPVCRLQASNVKQAGITQRAIADSYRKTTGLMTGSEIREIRKKHGLTQKALADKMGVGIASIKRWEGSIIQSRSMDKALCTVLFDQEHENKYTGNRKFSITRIKLVIKKLEYLLEQKLLLKRDKQLFAAKYLWYSDMMAYRDTGKSMTGATYSKLPLGPQMNNYKELIDLIKKADETMAESFTPEEKKILIKISEIFTDPQKVYAASQSEIIWKRRVLGEIIPYSDSWELMI